MLELVRVDVERDARACMAELAGHANRIDTRADQVTSEGVPEIVEPELGHIVAVKTCRLCRSVEAALRDVVAVEGRPRDLANTKELERGRWLDCSVARRWSRRCGSS